MQINNTLHTFYKTFDIEPVYVYEICVLNLLGAEGLKTITRRIIGKNELREFIKKNSDVSLFMGRKVFVSKVLGKIHININEKYCRQLEEMLLKHNLQLMLKIHANNSFEYIVYSKNKEVGFCVRDNRQDALLQLLANVQTGLTSNGQAISYKRDIYDDVRAVVCDGNSLCKLW